MWSSIFFPRPCQAKGSELGHVGCSSDAECFGRLFSEGFFQVVPMKHHITWDFLLYFFCIFLYFFVCFCRTWPKKNWNQIQQSQKKDEKSPEHRFSSTRWAVNGSEHRQRDFRSGPVRPRPPAELPVPSPMVCHSHLPRYRHLNERRWLDTNK